MNYRKYLQKNNINITKKDVLFELSNMITEARVYAGITQTELAKRIGTKQPSIARVESGKLEPSITFLEKVAEAVNIKLLLPRFVLNSSKKYRIKKSGGRELVTSH